MFSCPSFLLVFLQLELSWRCCVVLIPFFLSPDTLLVLWCGLSGLFLCGIFLFSYCVGADAVRDLFWSFPLCSLVSQLPRSENGFLIQFCLGDMGSLCPEPSCEVVAFFYRLFW